MMTQEAPIQPFPPFGDEDIDIDASSNDGFDGRDLTYWEQEAKRAQSYNEAHGNIREGVSDGQGS